MYVTEYVSGTAWSDGRELNGPSRVTGGRCCSPTSVASSRRVSLHRSLASRSASCKVKGKGKGSPYSITERRVPELIPVLGSQPAGDVSHKSGGRLPLLSARRAVPPATIKRAATNFAAW